MLTLNLLYFMLAGIALIISGVFLVKSLSKIAKSLGISEFSAAFIIMAFASSIPELFIGLSSALSGNPALSLGNIIGANILNLTLITGIIVLSAKKIEFKSEKIGSDVYFMILTLLLLVILFTIGRSLSRLDGVILLLVFLIHTYNILKKRKKYEKKKIENGRTNTSKFNWLLIFILALIGLFIASNFIVKYASELAVDLGLSEILIGLFLISFATTLPELVFGLSAVNLKQKEMAIGDQIGSVVTNTGFILGLVAIIHPISADFMPFLISSIFMFVSAFIFFTFIKSGKVLSKYEGISLILIYILFILIEFFVK
jgi:cation:H+ antiporter